MQGPTNPGSAASPSTKHKKDAEPEPEITPLQKMLQNAGPIREDGSDKFFGMENVCPTPPPPLENLTLMLTRPQFGNTWSVYSRL